MYWLHEITYTSPLPVTHPHSPFPHTHSHTHSHTHTHTHPHTHQTGAVETDYYRDSDLTLGAVINVWGRRLLLCDCDEFTREYYTTKYNIRELL